jgi:zinc protease
MHQLGNVSPLPPRAERMTIKKTGISTFIFFVFATLSQCGVSFAMPALERIVLPNQLTVLVFQDHSIPAVTFELQVSAGSWRDPRDKNGIANLTAKSVLLGTRGFSFDQVNKRLDSIGASLNAECRKDFAAIGMQTLKKDLDSGFDLFVEVVTSAAFRESDVAKEKDDILGKIRSEEDEPLQVAEKAFEKALFLDSPYASTVEGTPESLSGISPDDLVKFYNSFYRPNNSILVVGGDITLDEVKSRIIPKLTQWQAAPIPPAQFAVAYAEGPKIVTIDKPVSQASIVMGSPAIDRADKDYYAFAVMNHILGSGSLSSRLMVAIRVKMGLAYAVESLLFARKFAGSFGVVIQTKDSSAKDSIALGVKELERMQQEPVSEIELEGAKKFLIGNFPLKYGRTQDDFAKFAAQIEFYGLGLDYPEKYPSLIGAVTAQDILRVAKEYLKPDKNILVVVGDLEKAQMK